MSPAEDYRRELSLGTADGARAVVWLVAASFLWACSGSGSDSSEETAGTGGGAVPAAGGNGGTAAEPTGGGDFATGTGGTTPTGGKAPTAGVGATGAAGAAGETAPTAGVGATGAAGAAGETAPTAGVGATGAAGAAATGGAAGGAGATGGVDGGAAGAGGTAAFNCDDLSDLNMDVFPDADDMRASLAYMVETIGPRQAGSEGDHRWKDYLEQRLIDMGLEEVTRVPTQVLGTTALSGQGAPSSGTTDHIHGVLTGQDPNRAVIMSIHTDGVNAIEENGVPIILEIMEYLTKIPLECRKLTVVLGLATCHCSRCAEGDVRAWAAQNPDLNNKAIVYIAPEHAGHNRYDGSTIQQAFMCSNSPGLAAKCEELLDEWRAETGEGTDQVFITDEAMGNPAAWRMTGKPTAGSMSYWDTIANGLVDINVVMDGVDKDTYYQVTKFYGKLVGWIISTAGNEL